MIVQSRKYWRRRERGQIYVLMSLGIVALLGMAGLGADIGVIYGTRRQMQTAADAAAIAGANALQGSSSVAAGYQTAASDAASINGFTNATNGVTINTSQVSCPGAASEQCVQVNITQDVPTYFLRALGKSSISLGTVAIAGGVNAPGCIYALDPSASEAVSLIGNINISASCGLIDDSSNSEGLYATGNGTIQTTSVGVAGNYNSASLGNMHFTPTPITGIAPAPDPLASLSQPSVPTCSQAASTHSGTETVSGNNATVNLSSGIYSGGISIGGNVGTLNFLAGNFGNGITFSGNLTTANFAAGQYQNGGGSGASVTLTGNFGANFASGVSFCGPLKLTGNNAVTLQPGLYYGGIAITGNSNVTFEPGTYILAGGGLSVTGNSTLSGTGVTFFDTNGLGGYGPINLTGNETANLSAPTSGPLKGMLFFQDRTISSGAGSSLVGNSSSTFDGVVYFPTTSLSYLGNSSSSGYTFIIADTLTITGNASMTIGSNYSSLGGTSPLSSNTIYE
jgi:Flp pilus assembly protein TadG